MYTYFKTFFCIFLLLAVATSAQAARISMTQVPPTSDHPQNIVIDVKLDTEGDSLNAVQGSFEFPPELITLETISTKDSMVDLWIEQPKESSAGVVTWAGIIPGGFTTVRSAFSEGGQSGKIIRMSFRVKQAGTVLFSVPKTVAARNDGYGTLIPLADSVLAVNVVPTTIKTSVPTAHPEIVSLPAEDAQILRSPLVAGGKWFVAVAVNGNDYSVSRYQIAESFDPNVEDVPESAWVDMNGPTVLQDQGRNSFVHIRVLMADGRRGYLTLNPQSNYLLISGILLAIALVLGALFVMLYSKKK